MEQLIEDYKRRLATISSMMGNSKLEGSIDDIRTHERLLTKASEYRTFINDLERYQKDMKPAIVHYKSTCSFVYILKKNNEPLERTAGSDILIINDDVYIRDLTFTNHEDQYCLTILSREFIEINKKLFELK